MVLFQDWQWLAADLAIDEIAPYLLRIKSLHQSSHANTKGSLQFALWKDDQLVSRAELVNRKVSFANKPYQVIGVSSVLTVPIFCRQGCGTYLLKALNRYILASQADMGMLFCQPELNRFYTYTGWEICHHSTTRIGNPDDYRPYEWQRLILIVSAYAKKNYSQITTQPCYIQQAW